MELLKKYRIEKENVVKHPMGISYGQKKFEEKVKSKLYYNSNKRKEIKKLPSNKNKLLKIFKSNRTEVLNYVKLKDISSKSEKDMIDLFNYYNAVSKNNDL